MLSPGAPTKNGAKYLPSWRMVSRARTAYSAPGTRSTRSAKPPVADKSDEAEAKDTGTFAVSRLTNSSSITSSASVRMRAPQRSERTIAETVLPTASATSTPGKVIRTAARNESASNCIISRDGVRTSLAACTALRIINPLLVPSASWSIGAIRASTALSGICCTKSRSQATDITPMSSVAKTTITWSPAGAVQVSTTRTRDAGSSRRPNSLACRASSCWARKSPAATSKWASSALLLYKA
mmetsp:Transcript_44334/g.99960  ORF Transcript_44334/g.99960 Transcript_44334/m.99960 type:complete len:241 (+) Transcript_44334:1341-2063(+)